MKTHDAGEAQAAALAGLGGSCPQCDHSPGAGHEYPPTGWEVSQKGGGSNDNGKTACRVIFQRAMLDLPEAIPNSRRVFSNINIDVPGMIFEMMGTWHVEGSE